MRNANTLRKKRDFAYLLPVSNLTIDSRRLNLNHVAILLHSLSIALCLTDCVMVNLLTSNTLFPLWTLPLGNVLNCFVVTISLYFLLMMAVHISLFSQFLVPSNFKYLHWTHFRSLVRSMVSKSVLFPVLFSLSPLLMLYLTLWLFLCGNSPSLYFKPNLIGFHDFHLHLHRVVIPRLQRRLDGYKSRQWVRHFVYLLFNAVILDEYIMKKNSPHRTRVSFIGMLSGDDTAKALKRVDKDLDAMNVTLLQNGTLNRGMLDLNAKSWDEAANDPESETFNFDESVSEIKHHFEFLVLVLYPFHLILYWLYLTANGNHSFELDTTWLIVTAMVQWLFCVVSICILYIHSTATITSKPKALYIWTSYPILDFYCSFHDDDEQEMFKKRSDQYFKILSDDILKAFCIRAGIERRFEDTAFAAESVKVSATVISFCCVIDDKVYSENPYMAIMRAISRWTRHEHHQYSSSKASIIRQSLQKFLDPHGAGSRSFQLSDAPSILNGYDDATSGGGGGGHDYVRKWSSDSGHSAGPSSFRMHHKDSIIPIMEQKEQEPSDDGSYRHSQISPEDTGTFVHERGITTRIVIGALDQGPEDEQSYHDDTKTPETLPETPATLPVGTLLTDTYPTMLKPLDSNASEGDHPTHGSGITIAITPAPPTPMHKDELSSPTALSVPVEVTKTEDEVRRDSES